MIKKLNKIVEYEAFQMKRLECMQWFKKPTWLSDVFAITKGGFSKIKMKIVHEASLKFWSFKNKKSGEYIFIFVATIKCPSVAS